MKKIGTAIATLALAVGLTACTGGTTHYHSTPVVVHHVVTHHVVVHHVVVHHVVVKHH